MATLCDIQLELLSKLKLKSYDDLIREIPGFEYSDERFVPGQKITVAITSKKGTIYVRSEAIDVPLNIEEQKEMERLFGKEDYVQTQTIEWHDGFDMDSLGNTTNLHPSDCDD